MGVAHKGDGKSKTSFDSTAPQGEREDSYQEHDRSDDKQYQAEIYEKQRSWKILGGVLVVIIASLLFTNQSEYSSNPLSDFAIHEKGLKTDADNRTQFKDA